jgi:iron complex outermembrane receptor protein
MLALVLLCFFSNYSFAQSPSTTSSDLNKPQIAKGIFYFKLSAQDADKALIAFAQQADQTIIFSYELSKNYTTNAINGYFSLSLGLTKLLKNTGLSATVNKNGLWSISAVTEPQPSLQNAKLADKNIEKSSLISEYVEKISVLGSHIQRRSVNDLPVPVDIISGESLRLSGQTNIGSMLQALAPSFNFSHSSISDGSDVLQPATLRGLGPDQTLILVNGKRRHQASLIHINNSVGRGTAGSDINAIPIAAIKRIEILRDGAAAQYGSDAIAGVINIVLNDNDEQTSLSISTGEYKAGDGENSQISYTKGFNLYDIGFINTTVSFTDNNNTNRSGLHGACQFNQCTTLPNGHMQTADPREIAAERSTFLIGSPSYQQLNFAANSQLELFDGLVYSFITFSQRENESAAFFRHNANEDENPILSDGDATIPLGYLPKISSDIEDYSYNLGYIVEFSNDSTVDFSYTYGENSIDYTTKDSINASYANYLNASAEIELTPDEIRSTIPRSAYAYGLSLSLETFNLTFTQEYNNYTLALGTELRSDNYQLLSGEKYSYSDYDTQDNNNLFELDVTGSIQGFPGVSPELCIDESRDIISFFAEAMGQATPDLQLTAAVRFDDYETFGNSASFKLAAHWQLYEKVTFRGSISTGFRAPSMQQLYFNNISTQFIVDETGTLLSEEVETFRNDSTLTTNLGVPQLKEEESTNLSLGFIYQPYEKLDFAIDYYHIAIDDRIVISSKMGTGLSPILDQALMAENATKGQFFLNGANTETEGIDFVSTWHTQAWSGELEFIFAANFTETNVVSLFTPTHSSINTIDIKHIFSEQDISIIEHWQPEDRISLNSLYKNDKWRINLAFNRYGKYTIIDGGKQTYGEEWLTDLAVNYHFTKKLAVSLGANNLFDVMPDKNKIGNSRGGTIVDNQGNTVISSPGVFEYSRRSAPFGYNGAYYYMKLNYNF